MSVSGACALRSLGKSSSKSVRAADGSGDGESTSDSTSRSTRARWVGTVRVGVPARRMDGLERQAAVGLAAHAHLLPPAGRLLEEQPALSARTLLEPEVGREGVGELAARQGRRRGPRRPAGRGPATARRSRARRCAPASSVSASRSLARCTPVSRACTLSRTGSPPWPVPMSRLERLSLLHLGARGRGPAREVAERRGQRGVGDGAGQGRRAQPADRAEPGDDRAGRPGPLLRVREDLAGLDRPGVDAEHRGPREPPVEQLVEGALAADEGAARGSGRRGRGAGRSAGRRGRSGRVVRWPGRVGVVVRLSCPARVTCRRRGGEGAVQAVARACGWAEGRGGAGSAGAGRSARARRARAGSPGYGAQQGRPLVAGRVVGSLGAAGSGTAIRLARAGSGGVRAHEGRHGSTRQPERKIWSKRGGPALELGHLVVVAVQAGEGPRVEARGTSPAGPRAWRGRGSR